MGSFSVGGLVGFILILQWQLYGIGLSDRPLFLLAILLIFIGIQFVTFGLISDLQIRAYYESPDKPIYYVKEAINYEKA